MAGFPVEVEKHCNSRLGDGRVGRHFPGTGRSFMLGWSYPTLDNDPQEQSTTLKKPFILSIVSPP